MKNTRKEAMGDGGISDSKYLFLTCILYPIRGTRARVALLFLSATAYLRVQAMGK